MRASAREGILFVLGQDRRPRLVPQVWIVAIIALLALGLVIAIYRGDGSESPLGALVQEQMLRLQASAKADLQETPPTDEEQGAAPLVGQPTASPTPDWVSPTPRPVATRRPLDAPRSDHYWLERPFDANANARVARFYPYGSRIDGSYPIHHGVEIVNPVGTPVQAPASGVIVVAGDDKTQVYGARTDFYGLLVVLQLDQRYQGMPVYVLMAHLSEVHVTVGQHVTVGHVIGLVGETGYAEGPHLHTEVRLGRNDYMATVNPELWYRPLEGLGTLAGVLINGNGEIVESEAKLVLRRGDQYVYEIFTYPSQQVNSDPEWGENFCIGDLEPGTWTVEVFLDGTLHTHEVEITPGQTTWLVFQAG